MKIEFGYLGIHQVKIPMLEDHLLYYNGPWMAPNMV